MRVVAGICGSTGKRRRLIPADDLVDHGLDRHHLPAALGRKVDVVVSPPIPAAARIVRLRHRLRIQHDDLVGVRPAVVAGILVEGGADAGDVLQAAVKGHVQLAGLSRGAGGWHVGVAAAGHAVQSRVAVAPERGLVKVDEAAAQGADVLLVQRPVYPLEDLACGVEVAVVDERRTVGAAAAAKEVRWDRMLSGQVVLVLDIRARNVIAVHGAQVVHHRLLHGRIDRPGQQVYLRGGHIAGRVDVAVARPSVHHRDQVRKVARGGIEHAGPGRDRGVALRAVHRPARDDAGALPDRLRIREVHLRRHVGAGREAGDRHLVDTYIVFGERDDRAVGMGAEQAGEQR